jgi:hypothetical protein
VRLAKRYAVVEGDLYRRGTNGILMWCITQEEAVSCSRRSMEASAEVILHPARWSVRPSVEAFLKSIVCRFGVPSRIIMDNGIQFTSRLFQEYCEGIGTRLCFASVAHPRSNGQVDRANAEILRGLKTRTYDCLKKHGANWVSELPSVLWGNRTTPSRATRETLFFLVYGAEVCLPPEIIMGSPRVQAFNESMQEQLRREDVDFIDERRW